MTRALDALSEPQCSWNLSVTGGGRHLRCIREEGHDGMHKAYNGRWDEEREFRCAPAECDASPKESEGT